MGRRLSSGLTATAGICAVIVGMAAIDPRVRDQVAAFATGRGPSGEVAAAGHQLRDLTLTILDAVRDQSIEHAPLAIFALAAFVLLMFMLRS